jgi:hypothetical protein
VLPVGWVLVTLGTLLSVTTATAVAGMFVLGFAVAYAGVGGPRLVGLAAGTQLLYILPCFPPFDPGSLWLRLAGLTIGVLLLAAAEVTLWPDATPTPYRTKLGDAVGALARCLDAVADMWSGRPEGGSGSRRRCPRRPTRPRRCGPRGCRRGCGPPPRAAATARSPRPRARRGCCWAARSTSRSSTTTAPSRSPRPPPSCARRPRAPTRPRPGSAGRPRRCPTPTGSRPALVEFRAARDATSPDGLPPERLQLGSLALSLGEWTKSMVAAIRVAADAPIPPDHTPASAQPGPLWFAYRSTPALWWHRLREHLTPRSVYFQGALRLALALAVARLLPGCSTCRTASGCCSPCSPSCAPRRRTPRSTLPARVGRHHGGRAGRRGAARGRAAPDGVRDRRCPW